MTVNELKSNQIIQYIVLKNNSIEVIANVVLYHENLRFIAIISISYQCRLQDDSKSLIAQYSSQFKYL